MSKSNILSTILANLFVNSDKVISEKLTAEEHSAFALEVQEINDRLDAQTEANQLVVANLEAANAQIKTLTSSLNAAESQLASTTSNLTAVTTERDKYKAHHDKISKTGDENPDEDENSRKSTKTASYNTNAVETWHKANRS
tara:strand:- start:123 stop:548 length:426 start_codon:yes stop_codon:yes gene_type:complete